MKRLIAFFICLTITAGQCFTSFSYGREVSKAGQVFQDVKDGIVTIFVSYTHGSGSLVDPSGLILTNSHVVKENAEHLRVKFGPGKILAAKILENDRENDLAVIWVNMDNLNNYKVLQPFNPPVGEDLVVVGEEVIAVGSPIQRETLEKTMTTGIVGKFESNVIRHDASINGGNSGGPLINYDGQVVGVNTFVESDRGPAIAGAVPISKALPLIEAAKVKAKSLPKPSPELLPDIPEISFPIGEMLRENPTAFPKRQQRDYNFSSTYFDISVLTPSQGYNQYLKAENEVLKKRTKRAKRKGFEIDDDEKKSKNLPNWDYNKPVVTVLVMPRPKLTTGSKVVNTLAFITATGVTVASFGAGAPLMMAPFFMGKHEVKKDFLKMELLGSDGKTSCTPVETGRQPFTKSMSIMTGISYVDFIDKSYMGVYRFDAKCFETDPNLKLVIDIEGEDKDKIIPFPNRTRQLVIEDFKPYWDYVAKLNVKKQELERQTNLSSKTNINEAKTSADAVKLMPDYLNKYLDKASSEKSSPARATK